MCDGVREGVLMYDWTESVERRLLGKLREAGQVDESCRIGSSAFMAYILNLEKHTVVGFFFFKKVVFLSFYNNFRAL